MIFFFFLWSMLRTVFNTVAALLRIRTTLVENLKDCLQNSVENRIVRHYSWPMTLFFIPLWTFFSAAFQMLGEGCRVNLLH